METCPELLPCPFCSAAAKYLFRDVHLSKWKHQIECSSTTCGMEGPVEASKADAIKAWNRRPGSERAKAGTPIVVALRGLATDLEALEPHPGNQDEYKYGWHDGLRKALDLVDAASRGAAQKNSFL